MMNMFIILAFLGSVNALRIANSPKDDLELTKDTTDWLGFGDFDTSKEERGPHIHKGTLDEYLQKCQDSDINKDEIVVKKYYGRTANQMFSVMNAIIQALKSGRKYVSVPKHHLFDFPEDGKIPIDPTKVNLGNQCELEHDLSFYDCTYDFYQRCHSTVSERKAVFQAFLAPYLRSFQRCEPEKDDDILTIHVRSGDVAQSTIGCHAQPDCKYFDAILNHGHDGGPFRAAKIYTHSDGDKHILSPCIDHIKSQHKDKDIQVISEKDEGSDYCALAKAKNLAVTVSGFSTTAKLMNTELLRLFYPGFDAKKFSEVGCEKAELHETLYDFNSKQVCDAYPMAMRYDDKTDQLSKC